MATFLITGCSRGLGPEFVRQLAQRPASSVAMIFATTRSASPTEILGSVIKTAPDLIKHIQLDIDDQNSVDAAVSRVHKELSGKGLDVLINNAAARYLEMGGARAMDRLSETLATNVVAVHHTTSAFLPLLMQGQQKKIVNISSTMGSLTLKDGMAHMTIVPSYKISKTALNMLTAEYAFDLAKDGFTVFALSPGWVRTDLGTAAADLSPEESATAVLDVVEKATQKDNGVFRNVSVPGYKMYDGKNPPW